MQGQDARISTILGTTTTVFAHAPDHGGQRHGRRWPYACLRNRPTNPVAFGASLGRGVVLIRASMHSTLAILTL